MTRARQRPTRRISLASKFWLLLGVCGFVGWAGAGARCLAQTNHQTAIGRYVDQDVVAVGYLDLKELEVGPIFEKLKVAGIIRQDELAYYRNVQEQIEQASRNLNQAGVESIYLLARVSDWQDRGPALVASLRPNADLKKIQSQIVAWQRAMGDSQGKALLGFFQAHQGDLLMTKSKRQLQQLQATSSRKSGDRRGEASVDPRIWKELGTGTAGLMLMGDPESRRVVRELWSKMPAPFTSLTGKLVADRIKWGGVSVNVSSQRQGFRIVMQASDGASATTIRELAQLAIEQIENLPWIQVVDDKGERAADPEQIAQGDPPATLLTRQEYEAIVQTLKPQLNGTTVSISSDALLQDFDRFSTSIRAGLERLQFRSVERVRLKRLRDIAIASLNYEVKNKAFPPQYSVNEQQQPMLSWRVLILAYIEPELFAQFRLNERWDSEHNRELISKMPRCYQDPAASGAANNLAGKTIFQAAGVPGTTIHGSSGASFGDLTDGSSNTLLVATVAQKHAVVWTKPDDWKVDLQDPTAKLRAPGRMRVEIVRCDGSTDALPINTSQTYWKRFLLIADGNPLPKSPVEKE